MNHFIVRLLAALFFTVFLARCDTGSNDTQWMCTVELELKPSTLNSLSSPSGTGSGTGSGSTREEALSQAYEGACDELPLNSEDEQLCKDRQEFMPSVKFGNITLYSVVDRLENCQMDS